MYSGGDPLAAAHRYTELLSAQFPNRNLPTFDITLLGMGEDGHTASLFPGMVSPDLIEKTCVAVYAGEQHGWRISLTPGIFNRSENILILAAGRSKGRLIRQILEKSKFSEQLPISWIKPVTGSLTWLVDTAAGSQI